MSASREIEQSELDCPSSMLVHMRQTALTSADRLPSELVIFITIQAIFTQRHSPRHTHTYTCPRARAHSLTQRWQKALLTIVKEACFPCAYTYLINSWQLMVIINVSEIPICYRWNCTFILVHTLPNTPCATQPSSLFTGWTLFKNMIV